MPRFLVERNGVSEEIVADDLISLWKSLGSDKLTAKITHLFSINGNEYPITIQGGESNEKDK